MPIPASARKSDSPSAVALRAMSAYLRAVNLNGTAVQLRDCFAISDPNMRARLAAEVCLRARFEGAVAHALAPTPADPRAIELHLYLEIRAALGQDVAVDVASRVHALLGDDRDAFLRDAAPTDESGSDGTPG